MKETLSKGSTRGRSLIRKACVETLEQRVLFTADPIISEFMASNATTLLSKVTNSYPDWLEIHNTDATNTLDLSGWYLSNKPSKPKTFAIPNGTTIAPGGYLVVFTSNAVGAGGNLLVPGGNGATELFSTFNLGASGDSIELVKPDGATVVSSYAWSSTPPAGGIGPQLTDVSYGTINQTSLIGPSASGKVVIPTDNSLGTAWTATGFNDSSWQPATAGVGYKTDGTFNSVIGTNIQTIMDNKGSDAYLRIPFTVLNPAALSALDLGLQFQDGFVAYINGIEVARRNTPGTVAWNSVATKAVANGADGLPPTVDFDVSAALSALVAGTNVLSIQGLNNRINSSDFLLNPTLSATTSSPSTGYLNHPTPGAANVAGVTGFVSDLQFSQEAGLYSSPFNLTITTDTPGATIRYTTDGSIPTLTNGLTYTGPIAIGQSARETTIIRAIGIAAGLQSTDVDTNSYIFTSDVATQTGASLDPTQFPSTWGTATADYEVDPTVSQSATYGPNFQNDLSSVPTVSLVMDPKDLFDATSGIYSNSLQDGDAWKRAGSVEVINPDGTINFQTNAEVTMEGGGSRDPNNTPKHSFRLFFDGNGGSPTKLEEQLFPDSSVDSFNTLILHAVFNNTWVQSTTGQQQHADYIKDQFGHDSAQAMGTPSSHGMYMQLYINGVYWGLYNPMERPDASWAASYYGGNSDDWDVIHDQAVADGDNTRWNAMFAIADNTSLSADQKFQQLKSYVDYTSLADYIILMTYTSNNDWGFHNWYVGADRAGLANGDTTFKFWTWDSERTLEGVNDNNININADFSPSGLFQDLRGSADFRQIFADRVQKFMFNGGALTPTASIARYMARANQIKNAVVGESARWGDYRKQPGYTLVDWQAEVNRLTAGPNSYFALRTNTVLAQYRAAGLFAGTTLDAPVFSQAGGTINAGFQLLLTESPTTVGTIYYTLDGTDPRLEGGALSASALAYSGPITLSANTRVIARVYNGSSWSAVTDNTFLINGAPQLRITEINYHPKAPSGSAFSNDDFEFIELENIGPGALNLNGYKVSGGVSFTFGNMTLAAGQHAVIVSNLAAFQSLYGTGVNVAGQYSGNLSNAGAELKLTGSVGETILDFFYNDSWYPTTDGDGNTLVINDPTDNPNNWGTATSWHASYDINGTPGADELPPSNRGVVVSELLSNPSSNSTDGDEVELHNTGITSIDVNGWYLSDSESDPKKYRINSNGGEIDTTIAAGAFLVLTEAANFGNPSDPGTGEVFGFSKDGDSVVLSSASSEGLTGYQDTEDFAAADLNVPFELYTRSDGNTDFVSENGSTFGAANASPVVGPIVINEIMYDPAGTDDEFIELKNITNADVSLFDPANPNDTWQFTNGVSFTFPVTHANPTPDSPNPVITANSYALVIPSSITATAFRAKYGVPANIPIFSGYTGALDNSGEALELSKPAAPEAGSPPSYIVVDHIHYQPTAPWPTTPKGTGPSLSRVVSGLYGNDPSDWAAGPNKGTPGADNFNTNQAPVVSAGAAQVVTLPNHSVTLAGSATDDGQPNPPATLTTTWSVLTGVAANVSFGNPNALNTVATFSAAGVYVLQLAASDGALTSTSMVKITVNTAPTVNAGADQYIPYAQFGATTITTLAGSASDPDALPNPPGSLSTTWTVLTSPIGATVSFDNAQALNAKATFSASGVYVLRLSASDGAATATDDVMITVDHAPVVQAGGDAFIVTPTMQYTLQGIVTDDNLPTSQGVVPPVTSAWSLVTGPGNVSFGDTSKPMTTATFSAVGDYTLRLTATEGSITSTDDVIISVVTNPIQVTGVNFNATANTPFTGTVATFAYADSSTPASNFAATIKWGDGTTSAGVISVDPTAGFDVAGTHTYTTGGSLPVSVTISDAANESNTGAGTATVVYAAPAVSITNGGSINEAATYTSTGQVTDINGGPLTATVDYGDGAGPKALTLAATSNPNVYTFSLSHQYADNGSFTVTVSADNTNTAQTASNTASVIVADVAPAVSAFSTTPITAGGTFTSTGSFTDPGVLDTFTGTVNYGDGTAAQALSISGNNFSLSHIYSVAGSYTVTVSVTDNANQTGSTTAKETVNPASGGIDPSLVAWYALDEGSGTSAEDSSGHGNNAALVGGVTWTTGHTGSGAQLVYTTTNHIVAPDNASLDLTNSLTLAAWVKPAAKAKSMVILKKATFNTIDGYEIGLSNNGKIFFRLNQASSGDTYRIDSTTAYPTNGSIWVHVAATYDGTTMKLYINGVLQASKAASITIGQNNVGLGIGAQDDGFRPLSGVIDDARVYSRALSTTEVTALFNGTNSTPTQTLTSIAVTPTPVTVAASGMQTFTAVAKDQNNNVMSAPITWTTTAGTITQAGVFTAPVNGGILTITASSGNISGTAAVTVNAVQANAAPTIATAASASPSPATGTSVALSVLGADDGGEPNLTYAWAATSIPQGAAAPTYSVNASNAAKNTTASFKAAGAYTFTVTVKDAGGLTTTSQVNVTVNQTLTSITVSPSSPTVAAGGVQQFAAAGIDQFGLAMAITPTWTATGGSITSTGIFTAGSNGGSFSVAAASGVVSGSTTVNVTASTGNSIFTGQADIGTVGLAGSSSASNGVYTVSAAGADIWNAADAFHFVYAQMTGDGQIVARIASAQATNTSAKVGVMIRATLDSGSAEAMAALMPGTGIAFVRRASAGATTVSNINKGIAAPYWVKLVRTGNLFTAYQSADGVAWTKVGSSATITMDSTVYIGLAVSSHNIKVLNTSTFDHVAISPVNNLSLAAIASATSTAVGSLAANAIDGNLATAWTSAAAGTQSLTVDLGAIKSIDRVTLTWGSAYAKAYQLQTSNDGSTWTTLSTVTKGAGGVVDLTGLAGSGRFVRLLATSGISTSYMVADLSIIGS